MANNNESGSQAHSYSLKLLNAVPVGLLAATALRLTGDSRLACLLARESWRAGVHTLICEDEWQLWLASLQQLSAARPYLSFFVFHRAPDGKAHAGLITAGNCQLDSKRNIDINPENSEGRCQANLYLCPGCSHSWVDIWDCGCDDSCPVCSAQDISPVCSLDGAAG